MVEVERWVGGVEQMASEGYVAVVRGEGFGVVGR